MLDVQVFRGDSIWIAPDWASRLRGCVTWLWVRLDPSHTVELAVAVTAGPRPDPEQMAAIPADALLLMAVELPLELPSHLRSGSVSELARAAAGPLAARSG